MYEIAIIGAGPAGCSAAIFTAKAGKKTVILDSNKSVTKRAWLENYYGIIEISGPEMLANGLAQAKKFGTDLMKTKVSALNKTDEGFEIETENGTVEAKNIIIATGMLTDLAEATGLRTKAGIEPRIKTIFDVDTAGKTDVQGIWAAGTCAGVSMHAIITAGDGAKVAINLISEINGERYVDHDILNQTLFRNFYLKIN